jgi:cytochrome c biogenesis protein CcmG, thiol:disulfide interchange protein DsbE
VPATMNTAFMLSDSDTRPARSAIGRLFWVWCLVLATTLTSEMSVSADLGMLESRAAVAGDRAPDFLLNDLGLTPVRLSDFRGTPVVLNFFASWCGPCLTELPLLQAAHLNANLGYVVFGVATQDSRGAIEVLADDMKLTFPIVIDGDNSVTRAYRVIGPPYTFFIDANGTVIDVIPGALKQEKLDQLLDKLLNTTGTDS